MDKCEADNRPTVPRRLHTPKLFVGAVPLDPAQARHAREVLRLAEGAEVEIFDNAGVTAAGILQFEGSRGASVRVEEIRQEDPRPGPRIVVASAVPKGERADWMVEKLSELGVWSFIPLAAERSVVLPEGKGKHDRWVRIATESAKQSRRVGVMQIESLTPLNEVLSKYPKCIAFSAGTESVPIAELLKDRRDEEETLTLLIGPEGGWSESEIEQFNGSGVALSRLTDTILRVETAAVAAAILAAVLLQG